MNTQLSERGRRVVGPAGVVGDVYGRGDERAPLVLFHGLSFDRRVWDPVLAELQVTDPLRQVLAIDLPGHGESIDPWSWDLDEAVKGLHELLDEQGLAEPVLVGHSAGAILATAYAGRYPASGVINVDAMLRTEQFAAMLKAVEPALRSPAFVGVWRQLGDGFGTEQLPREAQRLVRSYGPPRPEVALGFWHDLLTLTPAEVVAGMDTMLDNVRASGAPYHVVSAADLSPEYAFWLSQRLPDVTWETISGGGHFPMLADPARFARLLYRTGRWHRDLRRWSSPVA